ncbi:MAG: hypothetical protein GPJ54_01895 [Candidatus Heimdallarchaeota archaeon]|nr:hypothetical protein [Candidatus Heimdallarchaeota archaeon]
MDDLFEERDERTIRERVTDLLRADPIARNDDIYLIFKYWKEYQGLSIDPSKAATILRNSESIRRARQVIQEEGIFLPTDPEVRKKRSKL